MKFFGEGNKNILIIDDYRKSLELQKTPDMRLFRQILGASNIDMEQDCYYTFLIPDKDYMVPTLEIEPYRKNLLKLIQRLRPTHIIVLGENVFDNFVYPRFYGKILNTTFNDFIGATIPFHDIQALVYVTYHPLFLMSKTQYADGAGKPLYEKDPTYIKIMAKEMADFITRVYENRKYTENYITLITKQEIYDFLDKVKTAEYIALDFETTGLKPYRKGHEIISVAISDGLYGYAFVYDAQDKVLQTKLKDVLTGDSKKIVHNLQFEKTWAKIIFGYEIENFYWDTLLAAHCINNTKPVNLKYLTYSLFGDIYDEDVEEYINASPEESATYGSNAINNLKKADIDKVLKYNALDSYYTYKLYELQQGQMNDFMMKGFNLLMETSLTLADISMNGICVNKEYLDNIKNKIGEQLHQLEQDIMNSPEVKQWDRDEPFNYNSTTQLGHLLFDILKLKPLAYTAKGKPAVDKNILPKYNIPLVQKILEYRKLFKIHNTYLAQYERETIDGMIHPVFNVHTVDTFRSSCDSPNIQQNPKRDKDAKQFIRSFIQPSKGNKIVEYDFSALEVYIAACHHKDETMISYIIDETKDMHRELAAEIFKLPPEKVTPEIRTVCKSDGTFAMQYGSYYAEMAKNLWEDAEELHLKEHLASVGLDTYAKFERHIQKVEENYWKKFSKYDKWRKDTYEFYKQKGYVKQFTGFICRSPMRRNNTFNSPVQGDASHVLFKLMNYIHKIIKQKNYKTKIIAEIHDSLVFDMYPPEEKKIDFYIVHYVRNILPKEEPWIILPLKLEKECSEIDGTWANMKKVPLDMTA